MLRDCKDPRYPAPADPYNIGKVAEAGWADLLARDPYQGARAAGAVYEPATGFKVSLLGGDYILDPKAGTLVPPAGRKPDYQKTLVLVNYLTRAQDKPQASLMIPPRALKGGDFFFVGSHALKTLPLAEAFGRDVKAMVAKAVGLGAVEVPAASGDGAVWWQALPKIALGITLYEADDEFEAEAVYTISANADQYLALDGLWALMNLATDELTAARD